MAGEWAASQAIPLPLYIQSWGVIWKSASLVKAQQSWFSKRFSNSLFLSPSVFQTRIAPATFRSFKDTFIYVHFNLTLGFKWVTEQSTESMMLLVMSLHLRGSQSIFQVFQAVTDFTKATAWKGAQSTLIFLHPFENTRIYRGLPNGFPLHSTPIFPLNRLVQGGSVCSASGSSWVISAGCQGRGTPGWPCPAREQHGECGTGTWKTRRLGQKERTPLGNLWMWRMNWNRYCLWGILLCTTLKAMKFLST